ncbi:uncharacterized protein BXZ73DRAFT_73267 [Epithele typhae]|uniref:uncharacterized protein n=1 Tax=Epithele typhae TaxID=378194 RepID=UPI002008A4CD|nr:uncharacterized protein BXZ73DRAFT_73267 [Epithele typhae]KAH9945050.1 hypothetical protein BXZ73DRAFT_73267 [Epithele typhae]
MSIGNKAPSIADAHSEDDEWEDIPETKPARRGTGSRSSSVLSAAPPSPRAGTPRRRPGKTTVFVAQSTPARRTAKPRKQPLIDREDVEDALKLGAVSSFSYIFSIISHALSLLRRPLGFFLFLWLVGIILTMLSATFRTIAAPVCWIPFISSTRMCYFANQLGNPDDQKVKWVDYPRLVDIQSSNFEQLLGSSVGGSALSLEIKKAEMATKDLITLVKVSDLNSRDLLSQSLYSFVEDAKKTGRGLQRVTAKINGAVDTIMSINDHALHTIEGAKPADGVLAVIWPFGSATPTSREAALDAFRMSLDVHASEMAKLVLELTRATADLDALDAHLVTLHELCAHENVALGKAKDEVLSELWTFLGVNRRRLRSFDSNFELLRNLGEYRRRAAAHIAAASQTVLAMTEEMEDLRERVAAPDLTGDKIPLEVHMRSIRSGMERIQEQRVKAKEREEQLMNKILGIHDA